MSIKKTMSVATVTLLTASLLAAPVIAQSPSEVYEVKTSNYSFEPISPFWSETSMAAARIAVSNRTITSTAQVVAHQSTTRISGTMFLEENRNGSWRTATSWPVSGTGVLTANRTFTGINGVSYRTRIVVTVFVLSIVMLVSLSSVAMASEPQSDSRSDLWIHNGDTPVRATSAQIDRFAELSSMFSRHGGEILVIGVADDGDLITTQRVGSGGGPIAGNRSVTPFGNWWNWQNFVIRHGNLAVLEMQFWVDWQNTGNANTSRITNLRYSVIRQLQPNFSSNSGMWSRGTTRWSIDMNISQSGRNVGAFGFTAEIVGGNSPTMRMQIH